MPVAAERLLQREIVLRLTAGPWPVVTTAIPNGLFIPSHNEEERRLVGRIVRRMRDDGLLLPGAPDLIVASATGYLFLELKREAARDLFGKRSARGALSAAQREFRSKCERAGVPFAVAHDWPEAQAALRAHRVIA